MDDEYMDRVYQNHLAIRAEQREAEGRCPQCGAFDGPTHLCPHIQQLRNQVRRQSEEALRVLKGVEREQQR